MHADGPDLRELPIRLLACLLGLLVGITALPVRAANDPHVLVLGCISSDPKGDYDLLKPLLDYVVPRMAGVGIREGRILMARDLQQMGSYLRRGRVDWVTGSSATGMALQSRASARALLLAERDGVAHDHSVFFARRDSGIAAVVLGPWGAIVSISVALTIQAIFFGDGGITAIGANCFNMAVVGCAGAPEVGLG